MIYNSGYLEALSGLIKELESDFDIRIEIEFDDAFKCRIIKNGECIKEFNYHKVLLARLVLELQQYSQELELERLKADMEDLEEKLIENERAVKTKEVVEFLDDYARIRGWNCHFSNLETCKSSGILRAVLISCKEKHPRFVSFYLENSIETIKKQIEGIRLN